MGALEFKALKEVDKILDLSQLRGYPALLLGYMAVEKKSRGKGFGKWICKYSIGLAIEFSKKIGCGYVYLQTDEHKIGFYEKLDFVTSGKRIPLVEFGCTEGYLQKSYIKLFLNMFLLDKVLRLLNSLRIRMHQNNQYNRH
jgi:GNAT superfamily N-acetyltransferase